MIENNQSLFIIVLIISILYICYILSKVQKKGLSNKDCNTHNLLLAKIHKQINNFNGDLCSELPEQEYIASFVNKNDRVLELGGNIGRSSVIIAERLKRGNGQLVVIEPGKENAAILKNNLKKYKNINIIRKVLAKNPLYLSGWNTSTESSINSIKIPNITLDEIKKKVKIDMFDTLVIDCEGCFKDVIKDFPLVLTNVETIILENDSPTTKEYTGLQDLLKKKGYFRVIHKPLTGIEYSFTFTPEIRKYFFSVYKKL